MCLCVCTHYFFFLFHVIIDSEKVKPFIRISNGEFYKKQDVLSEGDPYVVVKIGEQKRQTEVINNNRKPTWNQGLNKEMKLLFYNCT